MATFEEFQDVLGQIDATTTDIANRIQTLIDGLQADGLTANQETEILAQLTAQLDGLRALASDPENPLPPTE